MTKKIVEWLRGQKDVSFRNPSRIPSMKSMGIPPIDVVGQEPPTKTLSHPRDSNPRPAIYETAALTN